MKIWPLLITSMFPFQAYAMGDIGNGTISEDSSYGESEDEDEDEEEDFEGFYGDEDFVSISTGTKKSLAKAPSVASVITAEQIKKMGAKTLSEVLSHVPGIHVSHSSQLYAPKTIIRGMTTFFNPQTLFMVDGTPISSVVRGDKQTVWAGYPVHSIARVEVIRGPGSAMHGADAFSGVVNIITKDFSDMDKAEMGIGFGSFDSTEVWAQTAFEMGELKMSLSAEYNTTDGHKKVIGWDAQTNFDVAELAPAASLAPGPVNVGYTGYDVRFGLTYQDFNVKIGFQDRDDVGTGQGVGNALDPTGKLGGERLLVNINYSKELSDEWHADLKLSHYRSSQSIESDLFLFPKGAFFGGFANGLIGNPGWGEINQIIQPRFIYSGYDKQRITFGFGYRNEDLYRVTEGKNFDATFAPLDEVVDVSDTPEVFLPENRRDSYFAFIQDEYQLAPDWELTVGLRVDDYSDFGDTTNPRVALVWATNRNLSTKFLYGRAFRRPTVLERFGRSNPVALGNLNVKPETIDTFETAFNYQATEKFHIDLNVYHFKVKKLINFAPDVVADGAPPTNSSQNVGKVDGYGLEMELNYKISDDVRMLANYAYQETTDKATDDDLGGAPTQQIFGQVSWQINESVHFNTQVSYVGKMPRNHFDTRPEVEAYTNVALSLNFENVFDGFAVRLKVENLFDEDIREPSDGPSVAGGAVDIPGDLPQAGRALFMNISKTF